LPLLSYPTGQKREFGPSLMGVSIIAYIPVKENLKHVLVRAVVSEMEVLRGGEKRKILSRI